MSSALCHLPSLRAVGPTGRRLISDFRLLTSELDGFNDFNGFNDLNVFYVFYGFYDFYDLN
jgi:hypothetical protein